MIASKISRPPARAALVKTVVAALNDMKAVNVKVMDVRKVTDVADCMVLASGTSDRHVRSIADRVVERAKAAGFRPMGLEGERDGEWVLVDLNDVIVHVMLPRVREFYGLESLWEYTPARAAKASVEPKKKGKMPSRRRAVGKAAAGSKAGAVSKTRARGKAPARGKTPASAKSGAARKASAPRKAGAASRPGAAFKAKSAARGKAPVRSKKTAPGAGARGRS
jgi:ribosome-associated protein